MKYTIAILISLLSILNCNGIQSADDKAYTDGCETKAKEYMSSQFPKMNWKGSRCNWGYEGPNRAGFSNCMVFTTYWSGIPIECTPQKCICEICEQLK